MAQRPAEEPIRQSITVGVPAERAFAAFADLARWWPREYTWAADTLEDIGIDPTRAASASSAAPPASPATGAGSSSGTTHPPGLRLADRPRSRPRAHPAKASEVEVRFHPSDPASTRVELQHRAFGRHGDAADTYRQALASPQGWPLILARHAAALP